MFGHANSVRQVTVTQTTGGTGENLPGAADYVLWYAKAIESLKIRPVLEMKNLGGSGATGYTRVELANGFRRPLTDDELTNPESLPAASSIFASGDLSSQSMGRAKGEGAASWFAIDVSGKAFRPSIERRWSTNAEGMKRLLSAERVLATGGENVGYVRYLADIQGSPINNVWTDTVGQNQ